MGKKLLKRELNSWECDFFDSNNRKPTVQERMESEMAGNYVSYAEIKEQVEARKRLLQDEKDEAALASIVEEKDPEVVAIEKAITATRLVVKEIEVKLAQSKQRIQSLDELKRITKNDIEVWTKKFKSENNREPTQIEKRDEAGVMYSSYWSAEEDLQKQVTITKDLLKEYEEEQYAVEDLVRELAALRHKKGMPKIAPPGPVIDMKAIGVEI